MEKVIPYKGQKLIMLKTGNVILHTKQYFNIVFQWRPAKKYLQFIPQKWSISTLEFPWSSTAKFEKTETNH